MKLFFLIAISLMWFGATVAFAEKVPLKDTIGAGVSALDYSNDQQSSYNGSTADLTTNYSSVGINAFFDITQYFTFAFGFQFGKGNATETVSYLGFNSSQSATNALQNLEISAEFKYPFQINEMFSFAPKVGILYEQYIGGTLGGNPPSTSDAKQQVSPVFITVGTDLDFITTPQIVVRVPLDLGIGLNAKLSDSYYSPGTYTSSSVVAFRGGLEVGYVF